ncbi:MAG TPA: histidine kinase dimerization/phospho-acceptor domain-containing protein, partial [Pyrinomonadaceae bacterium]|nr:histidine kinase dimerization/phospho-acceptor domain-containing protein [Pyrinomonadaceae bacterium]
MGIRGRLVALVIGATVPLALLGLWGLRREWLANRGHLDELVVQQADLASVAFERWVDAQQQPLVTIAAIVEQSPDAAQLQESLRLTIIPRPEWVDVRVLNAAGEVIASEPRRAAPLSTSLKEKLTGGLKSHRTPIVETDWTNVSGQAVIAIGVPVKGEGAVIGRINAAAMNGLFDGVRLDREAVLAVHDEGQRIVYRRPEAKEYAGVDVGGSALFAALGTNRTAEVEVASPVDGVKRIYGLARAGTTHYTTVVGVPSAVLYGAAWRQLVYYLLFGLLTLLGVGIAALWIAGGIALPLSHLNRVAHRFGAGDLSVRAEQGGGGEIGELGETFNTMAARIKEREERLTELNRLKSEFVSGVSHELRTPLTTIKMLTRVMLRGVESEAERRKYLKTIGAQCDRQIDLVLNLLDLSRI